jgi:hypothetical protein
MGQYFVIVNRTKKQYITPWGFGDFAKLMEFGSSARGTLLGLAVLTSNGNGRGLGDLHLPDYSPLIKKEMRAYEKARAARNKLPIAEWEKVPHPEYPDHTPAPHFDIVGSWANDKIVTAGDYGDNDRWITKAEAEEAMLIKIANWKAANLERGDPWDDVAETERIRKGGMNLYGVATRLYEDVSPKVMHVLELCEEGPFAKYDVGEEVRGWFNRQLSRDYWTPRWIAGVKGQKPGCWDLTDMSGEMLDSMLQQAARDPKKFKQITKWRKVQKLPTHIRELLTCYKPDAADGRERHNFDKIKTIITRHLGPHQTLDQVRRVLPPDHLMAAAASATRAIHTHMAKLHCNYEEALISLAAEIAQRAPPPTDEIGTRERAISLNATV